MKKKLLFLSLLLAPLLADATVCRQSCSTYLGFGLTQTNSYYWTVPQANTPQDCLPPPAEITFYQSLTREGSTVIIHGSFISPSQIDC